MATCFINWRRVASHSPRQVWTTRQLVLAELPVRTPDREPVANTYYRCPIVIQYFSPNLKWFISAVFIVSVGWQFFGDSVPFTLLDPLKILPINTDVLV